MKRKIHLLCNAHIDPVWLWEKREGCAEAISTFRVAADFCEKYDGFIFNHNESFLYEIVEEHEPELFHRIKKLVDEGKWRIMGGWYIQPDCLMPTGESFIRQIEVGNRYFMEKFGVRTKTAVNFDSFGHTRGLVQILKKTGYDSYVFMRPLKIVPENDFIWRGYDGSEIIGHNTNSGYNSHIGRAVIKIENAKQRFHDGDNLVCWGIGNHGGGPSKIDLEEIGQYMKKEKEFDVIHSSFEKYFDSVDMSKLRVIDKSMIHCMVGCYSSMSKVKRKHRSIEGKLDLCEKMLAVSDTDYNKKEMLEAEKALLYSEFHDSLPGTMIKEAEENVLSLLSFGEEILDRYCEKAFFRLCRGQKKVNDGEIPIMVFNPHPYKITKEIEMEFQLGSQNWNDNEYTVAKVRDEDGNYIPVQNEKESCSLSLDWRKRIVFRAELKPLSLNRFDCELEVINSAKRPIQQCNSTDSHFIFDNGICKVKINRQTGYIDEYKVNGCDYLNKNGMKLIAYVDNEDPWGMNVDGFYEKKGDFILLSDADANSFNGYPSEKIENVRVIESGEVRTKVQATFGYGKSFAIITYIIPKIGTYVDVDLKIFANDPNTMFKLQFDTTINGKFIGQTAFGREEMLKDNKEVCFQKWCAFEGEHNSFAVLNKGTYGGSADGNIMNLSLIRTSVYSAHPIMDRDITEHDRWNEHIDLGENKFSFRMCANMNYIDFEAEIYNGEPFAMSFFPPNSEKEDIKSFSIDNKNIILSRFVNTDDDILVRMFNSSFNNTTANITTENGLYSINFTPYEVKTFRFSDFSEREFI